MFAGSFFRLSIIGASFNEAVVGPAPLSHFTVNFAHCPPQSSPQMQGLW
jgi:hypothetical protein